MIILILLDIFIYNVTPYNPQFFLLGLPKMQNLHSVIIIFLILSFFDFRYLFNLLVIIILYLLNKKINNLVIFDSKIFILEVLINYLIYNTTMFIFVKII